MPSEAERSRGIWPRIRRVVHSQPDVRDPKRDSTRLGTPSPRPSALVGMTGRSTSGLGCANCGCHAQTCFERVFRRGERAQTAPSNEFDGSTRSSRLVEMMARSVARQRCNARPAGAARRRRAGASASAGSARPTAFDRPHSARRSSGIGLSASWGTQSRRGYCPCQSAP